MSHALDPEEAAALAVLDALGRLDTPEDTSVPEPEDEIDSVLRKLHSDAIAMLAYSLDPVAPPAGLRAAIFSLTVGETTQEVAPIVEAVQPERRPLAPAASAPASLTSVVPPAPLAPPAPPASVTPLVPRATPLTMTTDVRELRAPRAPQATPRSRPRAIWLALAATLAFALVGAGFWIAYLQSELSAQAARLAWAEKEWKSQATTAQTELRALERRMNLVTSPAVTVFHLRCPGGNGPGATANANVYVSADQKQWELQVRGLAAQPPEREYQLWFQVGTEMRSGGCFTMQDGEVALLNPASFPAGTTGIAISLEPKGGSIRPTSPPILVSNEPVRL